MFGPHQSQADVTVRLTSALGKCLELCRGNSMRKDQEQKRMFGLHQSQRDVTVCLTSAFGNCLESCRGNSMRKDQEQKQLQCDQCCSFRRSHCIEVFLD